MNVSKFSLANSAIYRINLRGYEIRPMKLQKMIYYTVGFYYQRYRDLIVEDRFVRWPYGPVYPIIFRYFGNYNGDPIESYYYLDDKYSIINRRKYEFYDILDRVIDFYIDYTDKELEKIVNKHMCIRKTKKNHYIDWDLFKTTFDGLGYGE